MPLVRFEVRNEYGLGGGELYKEADSEEPKAVLNGVAVAGLVGILRQLGDLAEFAADVFHGLQEQVVTTASRSHKMLVRLQRIEASLPPLEDTVQAQKSHIHFAYTAGCVWHPKIRVKQKHFIHSDLPSFITDSYEECHDPPRLHLLDKFDSGGPGSCLKRYSDPSFFRKSITKYEPTNAEKVQRQKRVHKSKKKSSRWRNGELSHVVLTSQRSGRLQFGSPNSYGQSSVSETISAINMRSRYEQDERSMSDSRSRAAYIECQFDGSSSLRQEETEHNKLPTSSLKTQDSGTVEFVFHDEDICIYANGTPEPVENLHSSSVTWDEKTEIVEPQNHGSGNIVRDGGVALEILQGSSDIAKQLSEAAIHRNIEPEGIMCESANLPESLSEEEMDEAGSETDKYADALNSLESEAETDSECQTKPALERGTVLTESEGIDADETRTIVQKSEVSNLELQTASYISPKKQMSSHDLNLVHSEEACTAVTESDGIDADKTHSTVQKSEVSNLKLQTAPYIFPQKQMSSHDLSLVYSEDADETHTTVQKSEVSNLKLQTAPYISPQKQMSSHDLSLVCSEDADETHSTVQKSEISDLKLQTAPYISPKKQTSSHDLNLVYSEEACTAVTESEGIDADETRTIVQKSEVSNLELQTAPYVSSKKQMSSHDLNLVYSEEACTQPPESTNLPSDPDIAVKIDLLKDTGVLDVSRVDGCNSSVDDASSSLSSSSSPEPPLCDNGGSYVSPGSLQEASEASSISVWTNGGLLGLAPSKPPDYSMLNSEHKDSVTDDADDISPNIVFSDSQPNGLPNNVDSFGETPEQGENSSAFQVERCALQDSVITKDHHSDQSTTRTTTMVQTVAYARSGLSHSMKGGDQMLREKPFGYLSNILDAGLGKSKGSPSSHNLSNANGSSSKETGVVRPQTVAPFNVFGLSQRLLGNGYQRVETMVHDDISGYVENGITRLNEHHSSQMGKSKVVHHILPVQDPKIHFENKSLVNSRPSSPPLEHMKISFHSTDGFETSKLRLKFPGGHRFHESIKDVIFPSFQLLPEPAVLLQEIDSESDNDTFCRSSTDLSEDIISQYSRSSSEQWECDLTPGSADHAIYHSLRRVSSVESTSSGFEMEDISNCRFDNGLHGSEPCNGLQNLHCNALFDLPSFDTISSLPTQQESQPVSAENKQQDSDVQYPQEHVPLPPPLPPVEWRVTQPHFDSEENEQISTCKATKCHDDPEDVETVQKHPHVNDTTTSKLDEQRSYSSREADQAVNCKDTDEREVLLNQIRSKSFSLRRTVLTRPTIPEVPSANDKVVAILEKADAIRQAYVGSDEAGNDSWSDA